MQYIYKLFGKETALEQILKRQSEIQAKVKPKLLIHQLKSGNMQEFIMLINRQQSVPLLAMRKLTIVHYLLVHCPDFYESFQEINIKIKTSDQWLNKNIMQPYSTFLYKIIHSNGVYGECKNQGTIEITFRKLFYLINTLKDLFPCVKKMSNLSRYYSVTEKQLKTTVCSDYVFVHAYEAQQLYHNFKAILTEMMTRPDKYLKTESDKQMIKYILEDVVIKLNQDMKNLFLDKYFFPYGKGYGVKLFKEEELVGRPKDFIDQMYDQQSRKKLRREKKKMTLDSFLFDESGHLNPQAYHTLSQIRQGGDDSFRSNSVNSEILPRRVRTEVDEITENI